MNENNDAKQEVANKAHQKSDQTIDLLRKSH